MTFIRMIRHGETDWNVEGRTQGWTDLPLNKRGRQQAKQIIDDLAKKKWDLIVTSPLQRAKETAHIIQDDIALPVLISDHFKERHYGDVEGMLRHERKKRYPTNIYPNSESREALTIRVVNGMEKLHKTYPGKNILLITHGGAINAALTAFSDGLYGFDRTSVQNVSFTDFHFHENHWHILKINGKS